MSSQQAKYDSLQKEWRAQKPLHTISSKWPVIHKEHRSTFSGINTQNYQQENTRRRNSSVKPRQSNNKNHGSENSQVPSQHRKWCDVKIVHQNKDRCSKCGDSAHVEGFQCTAKKFSMQSLPQVWTLHQPLLSEKASSFQIQKAKGAPTTSRGCICQRKCHLQSM